MNVSHIRELLGLVALLYEVSETISVNGGWGNWGPWSPCSVTCGFGSINRTRNWIYSDGRVTNYTYISYLECYIDKPCPIDGSWSMWTAWSTCTVMCGNGTKTRTRLCNSPKPSEGGKNCSGDSRQEWYCNTEVCPELPENFDIDTCHENTTFMCDSGQMCVDIQKRCDGTLHCHDGSDEAKCYRYLSIGSTYRGSIDSVKQSTVLLLVTLLFTSWTLCS